MRYEYAYTSRPITYVEWKGDNFEAVHNHTRKRATLNEDNTLTIPGIRGNYTAHPGDVIIWDQTKHGGICYPVPWALFEVMFWERGR